MISLLDRRTTVASTKFSEFFLESASRDKKKLFASVLKAASTEQQKVVDQASKLK
jgi:hypothetical protein